METKVDKEIKPFGLPNVALYAKGKYERSYNVWDDIKACLVADGYDPHRLDDILRIVVKNTEPLCFPNMSRGDWLLRLLDETSEHNCHRSGFYHKKSFFVRDNERENLPEYNHHTAMLWYFLSSLQGATIAELGGKLQKPKEDVLPISQIYLEARAREEKQKK